MSKRKRERKGNDKNNTVSFNNQKDTTENHIPHIESSSIQEGESEYATEVKTSRTLVILLLILGITMAIVVGEIFTTWRNVVVNNNTELKVTNIEDKVEQTSLKNKILFVSEIYNLDIATDTFIQYSGIKDRDSGLIIINDMGSVQTKTNAIERIAENIKGYEVNDTTITDTTSELYSQGLPVYTVESELAYMTLYYYFDEVNKNLYSIAYSNTPQLYNGFLAKSTKEILKIRFE